MSEVTETCCLFMLQLNQQVVGSLVSRGVPALGISVRIRRHLLIFGVQAFEWRSV